MKTPMTFKSIIKIITSFAAVLLLFTTAMAQPAGDEVRTIKIKGTDNMKFDVTSIDAVPGETIKIVYIQPQANSPNNLWLTMS